MKEHKLHSSYTFSRNMKIEKVSEELIKPSSPTPHELRYHKISFIDETIPHSSVPVILFYEKSDIMTQPEICSHLKTSLSETLTQYYPLAGRMKGHYSIDCNDEGVYYVQVKVDASLLDIIKVPKAKELVQLTPYNSDGTTFDAKELLAIQISLFSCGGIAISICISHKVADGYSLCTFIKSWAATAKASGELCSSFIPLSSIFPPRGTVDSMPDQSCIAIQPVVQTIAAKRFIFSTSNIAKMRDKILNLGHEGHVTRLEAIAALLWKCFMAAKSCSAVALLPVNIRHRMVPAMPESSFGNFFLVASAIANVENDWLSLAGKIKNAIGSIDSNYVERIRGENGLEFVKSNFGQLAKLMNTQGNDVKVLTIACWCRFPINETDFGWGEPSWTSVAILGMKDTIILFDSASHLGGVEAWVVMADQEMALFEKDKELQHYTSLDASL